MWSHGVAGRLHLGAPYLARLPLRQLPLLDSGAVRCRLGALEGLEEGYKGSKVESRVKL